MESPKYITEMYDIIKEMEKLPGMADSPAFKKLKLKCNICKELDAITGKIGEELAKEVNNDCLQAAIISVSLTTACIRTLIDLNPSIGTNSKNTLELIQKKCKSIFEALLELHIWLVTDSKDRSLKIDPELN